MARAQGHQQKGARRTGVRFSGYDCGRRFGTGRPSPTNCGRGACGWARLGGWNCARGHCGVREWREC